MLIYMNSKQYTTIIFTDKYGYNAYIDKYLRCGKNGNNMFEYGEKSICKTSEKWISKGPKMWMGITKLTIGGIFSTLDDNLNGEYEVASDAMLEHYGTYIPKKELDTFIKKCKEINYMSNIEGIYNGNEILNFYNIKNIDYEKTKTMMFKINDGMDCLFQYSDIKKNKRLNKINENNKYYEGHMKQILEYINEDCCEDYDTYIKHIPQHIKGMQCIHENRWDDYEICIKNAPFYIKNSLENYKIFNIKWENDKKEEYRENSEDNENSENSEDNENNENSKEEEYKEEEYKEEEYKEEEYKEEDMEKINIILLSKNNGLLKETILKYFYISKFEL